MNPSMGWAGSGLGGVELGTIAYPAVDCCDIEPGGGGREGLGESASETRKRPSGLREAPDYQRPRLSGICQVRKPGRTYISWEVFPCSRSIQGGLRQTDTRSSTRAREAKERWANRVTRDMQAVGCGMLSVRQERQRAGNLGSKMIDSR